MFTKQFIQQRQLIQTAEKNGPQSSIKAAGLTDLRIMLLGSFSSGKSSVGNTILTGSVFKAGQGRSVQCEIGHGVVAGRRVTVVDSPGWWHNSPLQSTSEMDKLEIQNSMCLCPPGPHAALLTVPVDRAFTKEIRVALEEHMTLLSQSVWNHAIVLFTHGDLLGASSIEHHIEAEGEDLCWLVDKCGNRYHVLNSRKRDEHQVTDLLEKIEEMVAVNKGQHYEHDGDVSQKISERKKNRGEDIISHHLCQREFAKTLFSFEGDLVLPEWRLMLVGGQWNDRSTAGNKILQESAFTETEYKIKTQTKLTQCVRQRGRVADRNMSVVISPDWSTLTPPSQEIKDVLRHGVKTMCSPGPNAVLLIVDVTSSFSEAHRRSVEEHMELLGDGVWKDTVVVFMWGWWLGDRRVEEYIECEGKPLRWIVDKCSYRYHVLHGKKCDISEVTELLEKVKDMLVINRRYPGPEPLTVMTGQEALRRLAAPGPKAPSSGRGTTTEAPTQTETEVTESSGSESIVPKKTLITDQTRFRVQLEGPGAYECKLTGLVFEALERVELIYSVLSWSDYNAVTKNPWMVSVRAQDPLIFAGPIFNVQTVNPAALKSIQLPHPMCIVGHDRLKMFGILCVTGLDPLAMDFSVVW